MYEQIDIYICVNIYGQIIIIHLPEACSPFGMIPGFGGTGFGSDEI